MVRQRASTHMLRAAAQICTWKDLNSGPPSFEKQQGSIASLYLYNATKTSKHTSTSTTCTPAAPLPAVTCTKCAKQHSLSWIAQALYVPAQPKPQLLLLPFGGQRQVPPYTAYMCHAVCAKNTQSQSTHNTHLYIEKASQTQTTEHPAPHDRRVFHVWATE